MSKPLMERRRRERINHSLETLRLLMAEHTQNEKLKNPKVEKAEILESVVEFLRADMERGPQAGGQGPTCDHEQHYRDGMRSCLLKVTRFISSGLQESVADPVQAAFTHSEQLGHIHAPIPPGDSASAAVQQGLTQGAGLPRDTGELLFSAEVAAHRTDPVWRPWPQ
ncbi:Transcription factor HES-7.1-B [Oryzias melastigma]|nr:Transcription factor HES-7.1-B [Oryzias melastigma]